MLRRLLGALLAAALLLPQITSTSSQARQAAADPYPSISVGGSINAVAVQGSLAYIGEGSKLTIVDASDRQALLRRGSVDLRGAVVAVKVVGTLAYAATSRGMFIIDVSDPDAPTIISGTALDKAGQSLEVAGSQIYVGIGNCCTGSSTPARLQIFDASDPTSPTLRTEFATRNIIGAIQAVGTKLYLIHDYYFSILDPSTSPPTVLGSYHFSYAPLDMVVVGDYAYVVVGSFPSSLRVLDLRLAGNIQIADTMGLSDGTRNLAVANNKAYLSTWYGAAASGVQVIDVSIPSDIKALGGLSGVQNTRDIAIADSVAYLANTTGGLRLFDVSAPAAISELGGYVLVTWVTALAGADDLAYVAEQTGGFSSVDLSAEPRILGALPEKGAQLRVISDTAYLLAKEGLRIIDVADPAAPVLLGSYPFPTLLNQSFATDLEIEGSFAYITTATSPTLIVVDISNPVSPTLRATYADTQNQTSFDIDVQAGKAYLARGSGVTILDIHDLDAISELGHYGMWYQQLAVNGTVAYALDAAYPDYGVDLIDVSDPVSPTLLGRYEFPLASPRDIIVDQGQAYVAAGDITVLDVSDPAQPQLKDTIATAGSVSQIQLVGDRLYVNEGSNGFRVVTLAKPAVAPTVSTAAAADVTTTAAVLGGEVGVDGGATISERGVVYALSSVNAEPVLGGAGVTAQAIGQGTGVFSATVGGLQPGASYASRAYATNAAGTSYGAVVTFTTERHRVFLPAILR